MREALKRNLDSETGVLQAAILVYGGTKPVGCDDIAVLRPMGAVDDSYGKALDTIKPKGMRPLAAALDRAQTLISPGSRSSSIVLIADGTDNCKGDPCAVARSIKDRSPNTKIHVIALDPNTRRPLPALACVAQITGGQFLPAASEDAIDTALERIANASAGTDTAAPSKARKPGSADAGDMTAGAGDEPAPPRAVPPRVGEPAQVTLTAVLADGGLPVIEGVRWRVYDTLPGEAGIYKLVTSSEDSQASFTLSPGEYLVNAAYGRANLTKKIEVWPAKPVNDIFNLNAGGLRINAILENGQVLPENQVKFELLSEAVDQSGNRERVLDNVRPGVVIRLNGGFYHVRSLYGDSNARVESDVAVEAGKLTEVTIRHDAGKVMFRLVRTPGGEAMADTAWTIQTKEGEVVKESGGAFPSHILAAGIYRVVATHRDQEYTQMFAVQAGQTQEVEVVMPSDTGTFR